MGELVDAWTLWSSEKLDDAHLLWGLEIFWWGRIGKLLQTFAVLTIVVEIVGEHRLRAFGRGLHGAFTFAKARAMLADAKSYTRAWSRYMRAPSGSDEHKQAAARVNALRSNKLSLVLALTYASVMGFILWVNLNWWQWVVAMFIAVGVYAWMAAFVTFGVVLFISVLGLLADIALITPVAWIISRRSLDLIVKLCTLIAVVLGVHFDFLAS